MGAAGPVRLAEVVASLSLATDLGTGQPKLAELLQVEPVAVPERTSPS